MANTINKNIIVPEVYADLVREKITGYAVISSAAKTVDTLKNQPGEIINFPAWQYIGDATDIQIGSAMPKTAMKQTTTSATVKMVAAPAVSVNDYDNAVALGNALDEASKQQAISMARKMDKDCIDCALTSPLKSALATVNKVTFDEMLAAMQLYGDDVDTEDFAFIAIHSMFIPSFVGMPGFVDRTNTQTIDGNGIVHNNLLGHFRGIPVVLSDRLYDSTNQEGFILIVKKDSLGIVPKEAPFVEAERDASTRTTTVYCSDYYAVALIDESGIVVLKKNIGTSTNTDNTDGE